MEVRQSPKPPDRAACRVVLDVGEVGDAPVKAFDEVDVLLVRDREWDVFLLLGSEVSVEIVLLEKLGFDLPEVFGSS